mmetsp:Transcript_14349/g.54100  ORF Transcript_14349/g.54100 Transcript_14349/m.54100 type:complete len:347 (+) Transcript_14349:4101-5141(+)
MPSLGGFLRRRRLERVGDLPGRQRENSRSHRARGPLALGELAILSREGLDELHSLLNEVVPAPHPSLRSPRVSQAVHSGPCGNASLAVRPCRLEELQLGAFLQEASLTMQLNERVRRAVKPEAFYQAALGEVWMHRLALPNLRLALVCSSLADLNLPRSDGVLVEQAHTIQEAGRGSRDPVRYQTAEHSRLRWPGQGVDGEEDGVQLLFENLAVHAWLWCIRPKEVRQAWEVESTSPLAIQLPQSDHEQDANLLVAIRRGQPFQQDVAATRGLQDAHGASLDDAGALRLGDDARGDAREVEKLVDVGGEQRLKLCPRAGGGQNLLRLDAAKAFRCGAFKPRNERGG